jgi:hypothetical protein
MCRISRQKSQYDQSQKNGRSTRRTANNIVFMENTTDNRRITMTEQQHDMNLSHGTLIYIILDFKEFNEVCTQCVLSNVTSAGKIMVMVFWDHIGILLTDMMKTRDNNQ